MTLDSIMKTKTQEDFMDSVLHLLTENSDNPKLSASLTDKPTLVQRVIDRILCDSSPPANSNAKPFSILRILLRDPSGCEAMLSAVSPVYFFHLTLSLPRSSIYAYLSRKQKRNS